MGEVILLVGPHGVGKTSVIEYAREKEDFIVYEGFKISSQSYNLSDTKDFLDYQHQYLKVASEISQKIHNNIKPGLVLRSIEECSFYYYLRTESNQFMKFYYECVKENGYKGADIIIYLDASYEILKKRCTSDENRNMIKTLQWYEKEYASYNEYWKKYQNVIVLDTTKLSIQEIYQKIKGIYDERSIFVKK